jgi:hypothetical protein
MNKVDRLKASFELYIRVPWQREAAPGQRVLFCLYDEADELRMRAKFGEFELAVRQAGHDWFQFDLTDTFAMWMSTQKYASSYFEEPELLSGLLPAYADDVVARFERSIQDAGAGDNTVVALTGVGSLFGLLKVNQVVPRLASLATGRLLVFFPGTHDGNSYRLLDAYDGWDYLAVPITADNTKW